MEEKFTILKEDLKDNTSFFNKLDQALREVCHWNRDPFDRRTMLEVRNLFETDINVDEDGESEIEKELASSYHRMTIRAFTISTNSIRCPAIPSTIWWLNICTAANCTASSPRKHRCLLSSKPLILPLRKGG